MAYVKHGFGAVFFVLGLAAGLNKSRRRYWFEKAIVFETGMGGIGISGALINIDVLLLNVLTWCRKSTRSGSEIKRGSVTTV